MVLFTHNEFIVRKMDLDKQGLRRIAFKALTAVFVGSAFVVHFGTIDVEAKDLVLSADSIEVIGCKKMSEKEVIKLIPEITKKEINVRKLSRQIQMLKDSGAFDVNTDFQITEPGHYHVVVKVDERKTETFNLLASNSGDDYTGQWRLTSTYVNGNLTHQSDSLGLAWVTSPGHYEEVKQVAASYRFILPKWAGTMSLVASYSDVDMGQIANFGDIDLSATGKGRMFGAHYQQNIEYTSRSKKILDFGIEYKNYDNNQDYMNKGFNLLNMRRKLAVTDLSLTYIGNRRSDRDAFTYTFGVVTNIPGDKLEYNRYRYGSDTHYFIWSANLNYQWLMPHGWLGNFRLGGQFTNNSLLNTEQYGAGGAYSVRGFYERTISADKGICGSLELYTPIIANYNRFVLFTDFARLNNNHPNVGEVTSEGLASVGVGYRFSGYKGWNVQIDYAKPIFDRMDREKLYGRRWTLRISKSF